MAKKFVQAIRSGNGQRLGVFMAILGLAGTLATSLLLLAAPSAVAATCAPLSTTKGTATSMVNFESSGTYRAWVRMLAPTTTANGVYLQVADSNACQVTVGKAGLPTNQLAWVNWQNGSTTNFIDVTVTAGTHQVVLAGLDDGVQVDRVLFLSDKACVPTGDGANCTVVATPTPTLTPMPTPTPPPAPTPVPADTQPPSAPAELSSTGQAESSIALSWRASTDNVAVAGYRVKRNGEAIGTTTAVTMTYIDTGLSPNTAYSYSVVAYDIAGNESQASDPLVATTKLALDTTAPVAPTSAAATAHSPTSVTVTWAAATDNVGVTGYYILRDDVTLAEVTALSYSDTAAIAGTTYSYAIKARDAAGNVSQASVAATVTTPKPPDTQAPSVPMGLVATAVSASQINLQWSAASDNVGVAGYRISRGGAEIARVPSLSYGDTGLTANMSYQYTISAYDAAGNMSAASPVASAMTLPADVFKAGGLNVTYYDNSNLTGAMIARIDSTINFNWDREAPMAGIGANTFSVRWTGKLYAPNTGKYTFYTRSDDGVRLWVNGRQVVNNWTDHSVKENRGTLTLTGGQQYDIKMEFYDNQDEAVAKLLWSGPSLSKNTVPANVLYHR